jgi:hypothetical protein
MEIKPLLLIAIVIQDTVKEESELNKDPVRKESATWRAG